MQKDELNAALRQFVKDKLTPTQEDRDFVSTVYDSFRQLLNDAYPDWIVSALHGNTTSARSRYFISFGAVGLEST